MSSDRLATADDAYAASAWADSATAYAAADKEQPLGPDALERWGLAAYLAGRDEESDTARERAHNGYCTDGQIEAAARVGYWLALAAVLRGDVARGSGWFARVESLLEQHRLDDSVWRLFVRVSAGMFMLFGGDPQQAVVHFEQLLEDATAYDDPTLHVLVRNGLGQSLVASGRIVEGLRRIDEVMVAVTTVPGIAPQIVGLMYCGAIDTCRRCFDHDRAREWTEVLTRWCEQQPGLVPYRGQCLVHRAEVLQLHGLWSDADDEIEQVFRRLEEHPHDMAAGLAHYQRGELHRLRGEDDPAEAAYRNAARSGRDPQPGLALLRARQGRIDAAYQSIRRCVEETGAAQDRLRLLPAYVDIALAAGQVDEAATAADELRAAAAERDIPLLVASAAQADGQIALARDKAADALPALRAALSGWQRLGAPYDAAMTRVHIAAACRQLGDKETAELELDAARWAFEQLGAAPAVAQVEAMTERAEPRPAPGGLTAREGQVLRLVATGATNRDIARELFLSEKTVARHVANIFLKLDVTTRAAATAFAYEHQLV